ncbi:tetratricopeptide repeat protein [candidate division KSB1 bacterium]|nr:tetratricopeptide repeat protein [candidate division KSB1 bacterium]
MLGKQFFANKTYHPYLNDNFIIYLADRGTTEGETIFKKFSILAMPTVMVVNAEGQEIDRILGYGGEPDKFKDQLEAVYRGSNTYLNLIKEYERDSTNIEAIAKLTQKYNTHYNITQMIVFAKKVLDQPEKAKKIMIVPDENKSSIPAYEFAKYALTYSGPEEILDFATEFSTSPMLENAFYNLSRSLFNKERQAKALEVFDKLILKYPENEILISSYLRFCSRTKQNIDRGIEIADKNYQLKSGKVNLNFALSYADIVIEKGDDAKIKRVTRELIQNYPDKEKDIYMQLGFLYQNKKKYEQAFAVFEELIKVYPDYYPAYYQVGKTAAVSKTNLEPGIACLQEYLKHPAEEDQPPHTYTHFRLGSLWEIKGDKKTAQQAYEAALKLEPNFQDAKDALENLKK